MQTEKNEFEYELYQIMKQLHRNIKRDLKGTNINNYLRAQGELWDENTGRSDFKRVISVLPWDNPFSIRGEGTRQNWGRLAGEGLKQIHGTGWGSTHTSKMRAKLNCVCIRSQQLTKVQKKK